jgi:four helix bundle protein
MYKSFKDMKIWQQAMIIAEEVFRFTEKLPKKEDYGFTSQIRISALSISANIAEAYGRNHTADKINFYYFARGSATETLSHIEYGKRVGYFDDQKADRSTKQVEIVVMDINKVIRAFRENDKYCK